MGYTDSTSIISDPIALRERAEEDGYLFFRGLLPKDLVLELRRQILGVLDRNNLIDRGHPLLDAYVNRETVLADDIDRIVAAGLGVRPELYAEVQRLELFHALPHHPAMKTLYRNLFGEEVFVHPRHIARIMVPADYNHATPLHQDFIHIQGTTNVWTAWFPMGDCPRELGGLSVARGSHQLGLLPVGYAQGAGNYASQLCDEPEWIEDNFRCGDVLTFHSHTVHKGQKPSITDRIRLSGDVRYQPASEGIEQRSLEPHCAVTTWEDIYAGWKSDKLKYYWQQNDLSMSPWDESIRWQKEKIC